MLRVSLGVIEDDVHPRIDYIVNHRIIQDMRAHSWGNSVTGTSLAVIAREHPTTVDASVAATIGWRVCGRSRVTCIHSKVYALTYCSSWKNTSNIKVLKTYDT